MDLVVKGESITHSQFLLSLLQLVTEFRPGTLISYRLTFIIFRLSFLLNFLVTITQNTNTKYSDTLESQNRHSSTVHILNNLFQTIKKIKNMLSSSQYNHS